MSAGLPSDIKEPPIKLTKLIQDLAGAVVTGNQEAEIGNLEYDSRLIKKDSLFMAIKGYKENGYNFVSDAVAKGAIAVMGERGECPEAKTHISVPNIREAMALVSARFYDFPGRKIKVCGVTGTNGKTTTCYMIRNILQARNKTVGLVTSQVYDTGKEQFPAERTTPESLDMQRLLVLMKKNFCVNAVVEASSHALSLHRLDQISFRVAVYTNITRDHLDFHKDMDDYLAAKAKLIECLDGPLSYAVINLDVPEFRPLFGDVKSSFMSYSLSDATADVYCSDYEIKPEGTTFNLVTPMNTNTVHLKLPGRFNLMNALAAAAAGLASGIDIDNVVKGLEATRAVPGRFEPLVAGQPFGVVIDYAHTPDALQRLCEATREISKGRLLLMFGCGGDRDQGKRPLMGTVAVNNADVVIITSDNPRSENPEAIAEEIKPGLDKDNYEIILNRPAAVRAIISKAREGDVVLLAGKGAETYQEIGHDKQAYSEIDEARRALSELGYTG